MNTSIQFNSNEQMLHESEMIQAFEAQKMVNRQLESELTALTEANNSRIFDLNEEIDKLRDENNQYQEIMHVQIRRSDVSPEQSVNDDADNVSIEQQQQQNIAYLMQEVKTISADYVDVLAENTRMMKAIDELAKNNQTLGKRLRYNGLDDSIETHENTEETALMVHKKPTSYQGPLSLSDANGLMEFLTYQIIVFFFVFILVFHVDRSGIFKYRGEDIGKFLQRIVDDLEPRVAKTLMPALPAYILFMCIRYCF